MSFIGKIKDMFRRAKQRIRRIIRITADNIRTTIRNIWRNAETVGILTLASLGTSHFVGSYVLADPVLNSLIFAELIGPVVAVSVIWGLLKLSEFRRNRRRSTSAALA